MTTESPPNIARFIKSSIRALEVGDMMLGKVCGQTNNSPSPAEMRHTYAALRGLGLPRNHVANAMRSDDQKAWSDLVSSALGKLSDMGVTMSGIQTSTVQVYKFAAPLFPPTQAAALKLDNDILNGKYIPTTLVDTLTRPNTDPRKKLYDIARPLALGAVEAVVDAALDTPEWTQGLQIVDTAINGEMFNLEARNAVVEIHTLHNRRTGRIAKGAITTDKAAHNAMLQKDEFGEKSTDGILYPATFELQVRPPKKRDSRGHVATHSRSKNGLLGKISKKIHELDPRDGENPKNAQTSLAAMLQDIGGIKHIVHGDEKFLEEHCTKLEQLLCERFGSKNPENACIELGDEEQRGVVRDDNTSNTASSHESTFHRRWIVRPFGDDPQRSHITVEVQVCTAQQEIENEHAFGSQGEDGKVIGSFRGRPTYEAKKNLALLELMTKGRGVTPEALAERLDARAKARINELSAGRAIIPETHIFRYAEGGKGKVSNLVAEEF